MSILAETFYREDINNGNCRAVGKWEETLESQEATPPRSGLVLRANCELF